MWVCFHLHIIGLKFCKKLSGQKEASPYSYSIQYYQIRIRSDPHNFTGSGSSQLISIPSTCIFLLFHENCNMLSKIPVWRIRDVYPGSRILIFTHSGCWMLDPGSRIPDLGSRISDPRSKNQQQKRGVKKNFLITFYVDTNFTKLKIILVLKC
jgi:hypothetical protein